MHIFRSALDFAEAQMAEIRPFRAYRYDTKRVALKDVLTQPYDKITPQMQERYYAASPYNLIAIEKGLVLLGDSTSSHAASSDSTSIGSGAASVSGSVTSGSVTSGSVTSGSVKGSAANNFAAAVTASRAPAETNVYTRAAQKVDEWIAENILVRDAAPSVYVYSQDYLVPGTHSRRIRIGFIALGRVEDYSAHVVFPHERTLSAPKADRIELLRHTHVQTGQLFMLYDDASRRIETMLEDIARRNTAIEMRDEFDVTHKLWPVADADVIKRIEAAMAEQKLVIADGHHRYETALNYRNECRAQAGKPDPMAAYEFAMMTLINTHSKGLTILPTHRLLRNLENFDFERFREGISHYFDWYAYPFQDAEERAATFAEFRRDLEGTNHGRRAIGIYAASPLSSGTQPGATSSVTTQPGATTPASGAFYLFLLRRDVDLELLLPDLSEAQRGLDVVLLHRVMFEKGLGITAEAVAAEKYVSYEREFDSAIAAVDRGDAQLACLLNPVRVKQVTDIALSGGVLPQKSTDFYPKLLSGEAIYKVEGHIE
jgi:uncharacterized protein (DUF1015 family)